MPRAKKAIIAPSKEVAEYWIECCRPKKFPYPDQTDRRGKWLVFLRRDEADETWFRIKDAVECGELGGAAKISTNHPGSIRFNPKEQVVCVYTYDYDDEADVMRIRQRLHDLGVTWEISYKSDEDTFNLKYRVTGHRNISKYRS